MIEARMAESKKESEPAEVMEPGGRKTYSIDKMTNDALAAAYGDAVRFRAHGPSGMVDDYLSYWLRDARAELRKRGKLDLVKEYLQLYFDPSRTPALFGPGAEAMSAEAISQTAIELTIAPRALQPAGRKESGSPRSPASATA
jgi:hypothetical protein